MSKNKKRLLSVLLALAMLCSIVSPVWAEIPRGVEDYYALEKTSYGRRYMQDILIADDKTERKQLPTDLNNGANGDYIFLYYTKDPTYGSPIQAIDANEKAISILDQYHDKIVRFGDHQWYDVNSRAGGDYIYLSAMTGFQPVNIPKLRQLVEAAEECLNDSERYTDVSALQVAYKNAKATLREWGNDKYYDGTLFMTSQVPSDIRILEGVLKELIENNTIGGSGGGNNDGNTGDNDNNDNNVGIEKPEWPDFDNINQEVWNKWLSYTSQWWKDWADQYGWSNLSDWYDWSNKQDWSNLSDWYNWYRK